MAIAMLTNSIGASRQGAPSDFLCVACGNGRCTRKPVVSADPQQRPFDLFRCVDCGLVQQHPRDSSHRVAALCEQDYHALNESESCRWARAVQQYVVHLLPWESKPAKRLLDLGCGLGYLAALARRRGWRVIGLDISPDYVSRAVVNFNLDARAGTLAQYRFTLPPIDAAFLGDVIEHVANPAALLEEVRAVLGSDGMICIETPNWAGRWRKLSRPRWLGIKRYSVNLFDSEALVSLLGRCGFTDIRTGSYAHHSNGPRSSGSEIQSPDLQFPKPPTWSANRLFSWFSRRDTWAGLNDDLPATLEDARRRVSELSRHCTELTSKHSGQTLTAFARCS